MLNVMKVFCAALLALCAVAMFARGEPQFGEKKCPTGGCPNVSPVSVAPSRYVPRQLLTAPPPPVNTTPAPKLAPAKPNPAQAWQFQPMPKGPAPRVVVSPPQVVASRVVVQERVFTQVVQARPLVTILTQPRPIRNALAMFFLRMALR